MTKKEVMAMYLPHRLKIQVGEKTAFTDIRYVYYNSVFYKIEFESGDKIHFKSKPILRPLSMLTEPCLPDGKVPIDVLSGKEHDISFMYDDLVLNLYGAEKVGILKFPLEFILKLIEWHFDIAGLIDKGEAIAVTEGFNPYK